ncbi:MAG TPA: hypothetical protein VMX16_10895 [Terriglobia bacterium]|nr:hypothetical protein [Terriglobia bacterium]
MSKLWENFFGHESFRYDVSVEGWSIEFSLPDRRLRIGLRTHSRAWSITLTSEGELATQPGFVRSDLLGVSQLLLYNNQRDEQAIVCVLNDELCLMLSDPKDRFVEEQKFPAFFNADGAEVAYHAPVLGVGQPWGLTLLTGSELRPGAALVVLGGMRGCLLLKAMPVK